MITNNIKRLFYPLAALAVLALWAYLSSFIFFLLSGADPGTVRPWTIFNFLSQAHIPSVQSRLFIALGAPLLALLYGAMFLYNKDSEDHGDARWAGWHDLRKAGLLKQEGVILGKFQGRYLVNDDPTHLLCVAPTRSGKGVGLVIPNLLSWKGSLICLDIKHENYNKTAGFRKACGQEVFMWSPLDPSQKSHRYNPLDALSANPHQRVGDLKIIAKILVQDPKHGDDFWASEARSLFVGLALYVLDKEDMPSTFGAVNRLLGAEADLGDICRHIVKTHHELPTAGKKTLMSFANKAAKERSGVKSNLNEALQLWDTPSIDAATSASDFKISSLRQKPVSIYVGVPTGQIAALAPLLRIFFEQVITILSLKEPDETEAHKVLLMMDEFHMLGEMAAMTSAFTLLGGYNCRVMAVVQGLKWLDVVYGRDKRDGILSCCAHQIFFAANDLETANYVSQSCGEKTVKSVSVTRKKGFKYETPSQNISSRARALITKEKVKRLPRHEEIIITEAAYPVRAGKIVYYKDKSFTSRLLPPPPVPHLKITENAIPTFNIPSAEQTAASEPDPNQIEMFGKKQQSSIIDDVEEDGQSATEKLAAFLS